MDQIQNLNFKLFRATNKTELNILENTHKTKPADYEVFPFALKSHYHEIAEKTIKDKTGDYNAPIYLLISTHDVLIGAKNLALKAFGYFQEEQKEKEFDILSISTIIFDDNLELKMLFRNYNDENMPDIKRFFESLGENIIKEEKEENNEVKTTGRLIIPDEVKAKYATEEDKQHHKEALQKQEEIIAATPLDVPFLNKLNSFVPAKITNPEDTAELIYDLKTKDREINIKTKREEFERIFQEVMTFISGTEKNTYIKSLIRPTDENIKETTTIIKKFVMGFVENKELAKEDLGKMMQKIYRALYQMYIIQEFIDDPNISDVNITGPNEIRVRCKGKTYLSNVSFLNMEDYIRFIDAICIRNKILTRNVPMRTFTDKRDDNNILRFSISSEYVNSVDYPYLGIRKIPKKKLMAPELMAAGMFDEKLRDYLLDAGRTSRGIVIAGPPGCGKTYMLNWLLEDAYEQSADILIIQENEELFPIRKGVKCQHVVNYSGDDEMPVSLEDLGKLALVANANVFIIGEVKGAEICSAITLSNSGCRTAMTIHSPSSTETIDKMADLAMRGYAKDFDQAKKMLKSFQTIVYMQDFKVQEISEIIGYDEKQKDMIYRRVYKRENNK